MPDLNSFMSDGTRAVVEERLHQVDLGYDVKHDAEKHDFEELLRIGACYIDFAASDAEGMDQDEPHPFWPEDTEIPWVNEGSAAGNAVKGAAFICAALDLLHAQSTDLDM